MTENSGEKFRYLENEKSFFKIKKAFFIVFKRLLVAKICLRLENVPLMPWNCTSWSHLKLTVELQPFLYPYDPYLINNRNVTDNSVEKNVAVWNVIQNVLLTFN